MKATSWMGSARLRRAGIAVIVSLVAMSGRAGPAPEGFGDYPDRAAAERAAAVLVGRGEAAQVRPVVEVDRLRRVQLDADVYTRALALARELRARGLANWVTRGPGGAGYAVVVGIFSNPDNATRRHRLLVSMGYRDARIVDQVIRRTRFRVEPAAEEGRVARPEEPIPLVPEVTEPVAEGAGARVTADGRWLLEAGRLTGDPAGRDSSHYAHGSLRLGWLSGGRWEAQAGVRVDGYREAGDSGFTETTLDYDESFLRYRGEASRFTIGAQTVIWGRVDEVPPSDGLSRVDASRVLLDELPERRRPVPALRWEQFAGETKIDLLWVPVFKEAVLAETGSVWHPIDQRRGRVLGLADNPLLGELVRRGSFAVSDEDSGGGGIRVTRAGARADWGFTLLNSRRSLPYYRLNEAVRNAILVGGQTPAAAIAASSAATFAEVHPRTWLVGADIGFESAGVTWRLEAAWQSAVPVTTTSLQLDERRALAWVAGLEWYPGDGDVRVNLQLAGSRLLSAGAILDVDGATWLNGELDVPFANNRWRARLRFNIGIEQDDRYLNPEVSFLGWEPHEIYLGLHQFAGDEDTLGGFYGDNDLIVLGWRGRY